MLTNTLPNLMLIAIDGPAAAGKTTIGQALARHFHCRFINTGAMYRAVAWALERGFSLEEITIQVDEQGSIRVNGQRLAEELYERDLDQLASQISRRPEVREKLIMLQRELARHGNVVVEGRDIGTEVLPDADVKLYLTAPLKERARRRLQERPRASLEEIRSELEERDKRDQGFGRLSPAPNAILLSTGGKSPEESLAQAVQLIEELCAQKERPS